MTDKRPTLKIAAELHVELLKLADDYGLAIGDFSDVLLEYVTSDLTRIEAALELRMQLGSAKARRRRSAPVPLRKGQLS